MAKTQLWRRGVTSSESKVDHCAPPVGLPRDFFSGRPGPGGGGGGYVAKKRNETTLVISLTVKSGRTFNSSSQHRPTDRRDVGCLLLPWSQRWRGDATRQLRRSLRWKPLEALISLSTLTRPSDTRSERGTRQPKAYVLTVISKCYS